MTTAAVEHPNVTLFRRGYEAFNAGDMDTVRAQLADGVVWHTPGRSRFDVDDILANDTHGVALVTVRWEFEGRQYEDNGVAQR